MSSRSAKTREEDDAISRSAKTREEDDAISRSAKTRGEGDPISRPAKTHGIGGGSTLLMVGLGATAIVSGDKTLSIASFAASQTLFR